MFDQPIIDLRPTITIVHQSMAINIVVIAITDHRSSPNMNYRSRTLGHRHDRSLGNCGVPSTTTEQSSIIGRRSPSVIYHRSSISTNNVLPTTIDNRSPSSIDGPSIIDHRSSSIVDQRRSAFNFHHRSPIHDHRHRSVHEHRSSLTVGHRLSIVDRRHTRV